jgi:hypothetical protein
MMEQFMQRFPPDMNLSSIPIIIVDFYSGILPPYQESKLVDFVRRFKPVAIVIMGGARHFISEFMFELLTALSEYHEGEFSELGRACHNSMAISTAEVTCPVVQTSWRTWYQLKPVLNESLVYVTIEDGKNMWRIVSTSGWLIAASAITIAWSLLNIGLGGWALSRTNGKVRSLSLVVLWIEIASNFRAFCTCTRVLYG